MATRFSGDVKISITLVKTTLIPSEHYKCSLSRKGKRLGTLYVGVPAYLENAIDSPKAFDSAAHAALSFASDEEERGEKDWGGVGDHAEFGLNGWIIRRNKSGRVYEGHHRSRY